MSKGVELPHDKSSGKGIVASFKNLVEQDRTEALEKGAADEVDDGGQKSIGSGPRGKVSTEWEEGKGSGAGRVGGSDGLNLSYAAWLLNQQGGKSGSVARWRSWPT